MKKNELIVYHGSISIIREPKYGVGKPYNDYGLGFYCTQSLELAKEWAIGNNQDGYSNKYSLDISDLKILDLSKTGNVLHWITILLNNRTFGVKNDIAKAGKEFLIEHFLLPVDQYDIIRGYRADDSYFAYAEGFLNNAISLRVLKEALRLGNLGEQIVLKSPLAFSRITFLESEEAKANQYYPLREKRNNKAREDFIKSKQAGFREDDIFLSDILKGVDINDLRL